MIKLPSQFSKLILIVLIFFVIPAGCRKKSEQGSFTFVFMTDIHLTPERNGVQGFKKAIQTINDLKPDFVITGGDLIMDALGQRYSRADSLYNLYKETVSDLKMKVYNTMGNHEIFGIYNRDGIDSLNPEYGEKMFEKRLGKSYYSFNYKGWKFIILNSVEDTKKYKYIGKIDKPQIEWIKEELQKTDTLTPIVISTHIPFLSAYTQKYLGTTVAADSSMIIVNGNEVLNLFKQHNLKFVLQGHLHMVEDIYIDNIHFITGGAVCGAFSPWTGSNHGDEEGFMLISVKDKEYAWKYIDYSWEVKK
jgi:3',5'-cyclic AMP phosphodiesterase CpdA